METWILILTIVTNTTLGAPVAITSVAGFESRAACETAAHAWSKAKPYGTNGGAVCVRAK